jgi:hypothetical protein
MAMPVTRGFGLQNYKTHKLQMLPFVKQPKAWGGGMAFLKVVSEQPHGHYTRPEIKKYQ